jgi:putative oxidoreductase
MQHGYAKLARGPDAFIHVLHAIGVPAPLLLGWATILGELKSMSIAVRINSRQ